MASRIWKWHENGTYFHHHFCLKNPNLTVHYITGTYFFSRWSEFTIGDILWNLLKLWGWLVNLKWMKCFNFLLFYNDVDLNNQKILWLLLNQFLNQMSFFNLITAAISNFNKFWSFLFSNNSYQMHNEIGSLKTNQHFRWLLTLPPITFFPINFLQSKPNALILIEWFDLWANLLVLTSPIQCVEVICEGVFNYRKVDSTSPSHLEAHAGFFRLSMEGKLIS